MKRNIILAIVILLSINNIIANAATVSPTYEFSSSYKNSKYYSNLMNVNITGDQQIDIVNVALSQYGYTEGDYNGDFGGGSGGSSNYTEYQRMPGVTSGQGVATNAGWCAAFVSWCARQAGVPTSVLGNSTTSSISNYGLTKTDNVQVGSLAFVQFDEDVNIDHTALVYDVDDTYVYTIEGNRGNQVDKRKYYRSTGKQYQYDSAYIEFYGNPSYIKNLIPSNPKAPTNVKVSTNGTDVTVSWSASSNATSYDVYLIQSPWGWSDIKYSKSTTSTSHKFTGITPGSYKAFVVARPNDDKVQSEWVSFTVTPLPSAPGNVKVSTVGTDVTVSWSASENATSYKCYIVKAESGNQQACTPVETTSTNCKVSLEQGKTYYAYVVAKNSSGSSESSSWFLFGVVEKPVISGVSVSGNSANVSWNKTTYATSYKCYIVKAENGNPQACTPVETTNTSCTVNLEHGETYYAYVVAINSYGSSSSTWYVFGTVAKPVINDVKVSGKTVTVTWDKAEYATSYKCYIVKAESGNPQACTPVETTGTSCTFALDYGQTYYAYVVGSNKYGISSSVWQIFGTVGKSTITEVEQCGSDVKISWTGAMYAQYYDVYLTQFPWGWSDIKYSFSTPETTHTFSNIAAGEYAVFVVSRPASDSEQGTWHYFNVEMTDSDTTNLIASVEHDNGIYYIDVTTYNIPDTCQIIAAGYKDGKLISVDIVLCEGTSCKPKLNGDIDEIKVSAWNDMSTLNPLCDTEIIKSNSWETE